MRTPLGLRFAPHADSARQGVACDIPELIRHLGEALEAYRGGDGLGAPRALGKPAGYLILLIHRSLLSSLLSMSSSLL